MILKEERRGGLVSQKKNHKSTSKKKKGKKSGINAKASTKVRSPQRWAHSALQLDFASAELTFNNLDFPKLVAGEMEICLDPATPKIERQGRLALLRDLAYHKSNDLDLATIKGIYGAVLRKIEVGRATWASDFQTLQSQVVTNKISRPKLSLEKSEKTDKGSKKSGTKSIDNRVLFCRDYQKNRCTHSETPHRATFQNKSVWVHHMCATCWLKDKTMLAHPETSASCQYFGEH